MSGGPERVFGFAGWSGSGKTTLIEQVIPRLVARGISVSLIKHAHHDFDVDTPGKDSWRHSQAGAQAYAVASPSQLAFVAELDKEPSLSTIVARYFPSHDVVVCEGYRHETPWVVEVFRAGHGREAPLLDPSVALAVVSDADVPHPHRFAADDAAGLARFLGERLRLPGFEE